MRSADWIGFRQGQLTIIAFDGLQTFNRGKAARFTFRCDCGKTFSAQKSNIVGTVRMDCGHSIRKHGTAPPNSHSHPLYKVWWHMIDRCQNPNNKSFIDYGARHISVCKRWRQGNATKTGFEYFLSDMGERPDGHTIERIDANGNYEPNNCRWLAKADQSKNRRGVKLIQIGDRIQTIPDWCSENGIDYWTARQRIRRGWAPERAVTEPVSL
jgi:hypothetical protein